MRAVKIILAFLGSNLFCGDALVGVYPVGEFMVAVDGIDVNVKNQNDRVIWESLPSVPFLRLGNATMHQAPILDGNFQVEQTTNYQTSSLTLDICDGQTQSSHVDRKAESLDLCGYLLDENGMNHASYVFSFFPSALSRNQLSFSINTTRIITHHYTSENDRLFLIYRCDQNESFHGFGESFTDFNLRNRVVPILVSEQGVGRGLQPITDYLNTNVAQGAGGDWYTTYAPKPMYLTNLNHSLVFTNSEVMYFDLTGSDSVQVELWGLVFSGNILSGDSMEAIVSEITLITGRMQTPPSWTQMGAVVGLEGGTENVTNIVSSLRNAGVLLSGIWLQDWVGLRHDWDGDRLIWNWEVNYDYYPGWKAMVDSWEANNTKVLTYINPFFSDPTNYTSQSRHNFYQEGIQNGYFVKKADGTPYKMYSLSIEFCMLDLTNPEAVAWMKQIITEQSIQEAQSSGWMADFGEYLPFDAVLYNGEDPASYHNRYPEEWGKLTQEALQESKMENDILYFMRSAWISSPQYNSMFWLGDQLISWDEYDGLKNVVLGALSSSISGHTITHSDIGGYTVEQLGPNMTFIRSEELLKRWTELSTFGAGLFRTHIGSSTTPLDAQVYDSEESMAHFAEFSSIFAELSTYRSLLIEEAQSLGLPLMRPMPMKYGYDAPVWSLAEQFLFGYDFLVAPCMTENATEVDVYIPRLSGAWVHLWSGNVIYSNRDAGKWVSVPAGIGFPPVLYIESSEFGDELRGFVTSRGYDGGYKWQYTDADAPDSSSDDDDFLPSSLVLPLGIAGAMAIVGMFAVLYKLQRRGNLEGDTKFENASEPFLPKEEPVSPEVA